MRFSTAFLLASLLAPVAAASAQTSPINAAVANLQQVEQAFGKGVQMYACQPQAGTPKWIFLGPDAILYQLPQGAPNGPEQVATHSAGPVWQWNDGSGVFGTTLQSVPSPDPNNVPFLLLQAQPFGTKGGVLSGVNFVVRSATNGGTAPTGGCDAVHVGTTARVPYTAVYTFYTASAK